MVGPVDVQDVAPHLLIQRPLGHAEDLGDLHPREDRRAGAQEELARLAVEHHVAERARGEPALVAQLAPSLMEALPAQRRVGVVEHRELQLADERHDGPSPAMFLRAARRAFSDAPAENFGAFEALIFTRSPVRGLTPWRAARLTTENLPKPVMPTSSPFLSVLRDRVR